MTLHHRDRRLNADKETGLLSRRAVLRRSALGFSGIGLATLLSACADDDDDGDGAIEGIDVDEPAEDDPVTDDIVDEDPLGEDPAEESDILDEDAVDEPAIEDAEDAEEDGALDGGI